MKAYVKPQAPELRMASQPSPGSVHQAEDALRSSEAPVFWLPRGAKKGEVGRVSMAVKKTL